MQQKDPEIEFLDLFKDTEDFLHDLNPRKYSPPFMTTVFSPMRKFVFQNIQKKWPGDKEKLAYFISKFEAGYIETLRFKLREHYIDFILQKNYEIPEEINMQEVQNYGAVSELAQISIAVAEWTLELEISAYTLEGLELYGLIEPQEKHEDYLNLLKKEYSYKKKSTFAATSEYVVRRVIDFACGKVASLALAKGMSKGGFQGKDILDLVLSVSTSAQIPWKAIASTLNLTWVVGGFVVSHFCQKLNDYAVKREVFAHMSHVQEVFESNKLHLMTERKTIMDLVEKAVSEEDATKYKWELEVLVRTVQDVLKPPAPEKLEESSKLEELLHLEKNKTFKVKEEDDVVVVEEKGFQEQVDDSGVVVVEW